MRTQSVNIVTSPAPSSGPSNGTDHVVKIYSTREFLSGVALQWNISQPFRFVTPKPENLTDLEESSNPWRIDVTTGQCKMHANWGDFLLAKLSCLEMRFKFDKADEKKNSKHVSTDSTVVQLLFAVYGTITCIILFHLYRVYSRAGVLP